ncbi:cystathionine gamma-synthase family protein [Weeksellaceae bacterium KMM 9713]|uniref:Cystathionine gamma-synthase family protein n=1 Tax=Profundicola chukchiensis TaxID=2961959 RepID=A0A9X4MZN4_9FLAO|nr:cystathionine gamma-synthase family protein [Profundicola chukchiensis]MDG4945416.1 cystathionine gamma-synthase family protein [Profundicola chukchiensis]MDG4950496.1 cystathionine gamma-synthase family protein [Profundicola chukchiensis]
MEHKFYPESKMMSHGYNPQWSEGAIKCPIFQTSTFVFKSAEEGKAFFELAYGKRDPEPNEVPGLIYSRLNNPDLQILEERLCLWDKAEQAAVFESGMSAITTVLLEFLRPGDLLLYSRPVYGGTDHFINEVLPQFNVEVVEFYAGQSQEEIQANIDKTGKADRLKLILCETPANPTNAQIDFEVCTAIKEHYSTEENPVYMAVDNTYMGPLWQHPLEHGADLVMYSATKYIGGHSDLIAGAVLGSNELMARIKGLRTFLGNMASPNTGWLLMRSLETLKVRMEAQQANAIKIADFLKNHDKVEKVYYLGHLEEGTKDYEIFKRQCSGPGAMVAFDVKGGEKEAFKVLNSLKLIQLAVSLGSTESLAQHPKTMTHAGVPEEDLERLSITDKLIRLSAGVENHEDLIWDLDQALAQI